MPVISPSSLAKLKTDHSTKIDKEKQTEALVSNYINSAPDAKKEKKTLAPKFDDKGRKLKGKKIVITVTFDPELLDKLSEISENLGMTRTGFINMIVRKEVESKI